MTAIELRDLIVASLVRSVGGTPRHWRVAIGPIRRHALDTHPHCNWSIAPAGEPREIEKIEKLLDRLRLEHPIIQ